jgi:cytoskeletal protein CcmA (bactofilin family)
MAFINIGIFLWSFFILLYATGSRLAMPCALLAFLSFTLYILKVSEVFMFKKSKVISDDTNIDSAIKLENNSSVSKIQRNSGSETVIGVGVKIDGDICVYGVASIYGEVIGNITSDNGVVNIKDVGTVTGNISCMKLIVDGAMNGDGTADEIVITSQGKVQGGLHYRSLAIAKGGKLSGNIHFTPNEIKEDTKSNNIIGFFVEGN